MLTSQVGLLAIISSRLKKQISKRVSIEATPYWILALGIGVEPNISSKSIYIILPGIVIGVIVKNKPKKNVMREGGGMYI